MGDRVQHELDLMVPELRDFSKRKLFSSEEIRSIVKKRTDFEYRIIRRVPIMSDFLRYIQYEMNLDALRRKRVWRLNQHLRKRSIADYAVVKRIFTLFTRTLRKYSNDINIWLQYIDWSIAIGAKKRLGRIFPSALAAHPLVPALWIKAAMFEYDVVGNIDSARIMFQRGLRLNNHSKELWLEFFRMEMKYIGRIAKRKAVLGYIPTVEQLTEYKERVNAGIVDDYTEFDTKPFDPNELLPLSDAEISLLSGIIPRTIYNNACKEPAFKDDLQFRLAFLPIVAEWMSGKEHSNLIQAMSSDITHRHKKKKLVVNLDVECMLVANVNMENLYDVIFDSCKDTFKLDMNFWNAYARSSLILYNPTITTPLDEALEQEKAQIGVINENTISLVPKYLREFSTSPLSSYLSFATHESVAVSRFEESMISHTAATAPILLRFCEERLSVYNSINTTDARRVEAGYRNLMIEACRRCVTLGEGSAEVFQTWLVLLQQCRVTFDTPLSIPVQKQQDVYISSVSISSEDAMNIETVIKAAVQANAFCGATMNANSYAVLLLWQTVIDIAMGMYTKSMFSSKYPISSESCVDMIKNLYYNAVESVSLDNAMALWESLISFQVKQTVSSSVFDDEDELIDCCDVTSDMFKTALNFYHSSRPDIDSATLSKHIHNQDEHYSTLDLTMHKLAAESQTANNVIIDAVEHIKNLYLSWSLSVAALPCSASGELSTYATTLLKNTIDSLTSQKYAPHSLTFFMKCIDAEITIRQLLMKTKESKTINGRLKKMFDLAIIQYGSVAPQLWLKYLEYIIPSAHASSVFSNANVSAGSVDAASANIDDISSVHWRAMKTLRSDLRGNFTTQYDKLVHRYN